MNQKKGTKRSAAPFMDHWLNNLRRHRHEDRTNHILLSRLVHLHFKALQSSSEHIKMKNCSFTHSRLWICIPRQRRRRFMNLPLKRFNRSQKHFIRHTSSTLLKWDSPHSLPPAFCGFVEGCCRYSVIGFPVNCSHVVSWVREWVAGWLREGWFVDWF